MILFALTSMIVAFYFWNYRGTSRTYLEYGTLLGVVSGLLYTIFVASLALQNDSINITDIEPAFFFFYSVYTAFAFVPGLIVFRKIAKNRNYRFGKYVVYFGYFWSIVVVGVGFSLAIFTTVTLGEGIINSGVSFSSIRIFVKVLTFLYYSNWGFVAVFFILFGIYFRVLRDKARSTFIAYACLNLFSILVFVIIDNTFGEYNSFISKVTTVYGIMFALSDTPVAISFIIAIYYGHLWVSQTLNDKVEVTDDENTASFEAQPTTRLNQ